MLIGVCRLTYCASMLDSVSGRMLITSTKQKGSTEAVLVLVLVLVLVRHSKGQPYELAYIALCLQE